MLSNHAARLAAKFGRNTNRHPNHFHPLICHMVDVAAVAEALWDAVLPRTTKERLQQALDIEDEAQTRSWIAFLAGLHDLGKACPAFQQKDQFARSRLAGLPFGQVASDPGHGAVTGEVLCRLLESEFGTYRRVAARLAEILAGHHGFFQAGFSNAKGACIGESDPETQQAWEALRLELVRELARLTGARPGAVRASSLSNAMAMVLAGLVSVADWIGSIDEPGFFEYAPDGAGDPAAYQGKARYLAKNALAKLGWLNEPRPAEVRSFRELFPWEPRGLQDVVEKHAIPDHPSLVIIEAPMGEGKTEAALLLADAWAASGWRGAYVALPTQATANQLHRRTAEFLQRAFPGKTINLQLVHGGLSFDDHGIEPGHIESGNDAEQGAVEAAEWFLPRKRSLLGFWGVGTVDQALLAVLQVKHVFVRLFGLAGKPLIVDEVHAYDTYMTGLLERLLEWLAALGSPVVLLSATLPSVRRRALMEAYQRGLGGPELADDSADSVPYPRVSWLAGNRIHARTFDTRPQPPLELGWIPDTADAVGGLLHEQLAEGGCAVVICNTVGRAQETYLALRERFGEHVELFHARFRAKERNEIESRCLRRYGKESTGEERCGRILVATQVVEQSLDLDFDVMVTDFAPVDLLLQRSGRLHRHDRGNRPWPRRLYIRGPERDESGLPVFDAGTKAVYDEHILLRTWVHLRDRAAIALPGDVQALVDAVYANEPAPPPSAEEQLQARWVETWNALQEKKAAERREAEERRLTTPLAELQLSKILKHPGEEDAPDLHPNLQALTRLANPSVSLVLLPADSDLVPADREALSADRIQALLMHSVSTSRPGLVEELSAMSPPSAFTKVAALRRHRLVLLGDDGTAAVGRWRLAYDSELGLTIDRPEGSR